MIIFFFEIYYSIKYFKSGNFYKPPNIYPCPYYFIHKISQFVNKKKIGSIIDLGCGSGRITNFLNDTTKAKICGYEIDKEAFDLANKNRGTNVTIKFGNILNISQITNDFLIIGLDTIHVPHPLKSQIPVVDCFCKT